VVTGGIILWSGAIGAIPAGYVLCNGANGTPDLRNRFIVGAGSTYAVGANGGSNLQTTNLAIAAMGDGNLQDMGGVGDFYTYTDQFDNRPPYYALAYIMKT